MTAPQTSRYRGYDLVLRRQWSSWCVGMYPTRAELPILPRSALSTLAPRKADAIAEAKHAIDRVLSRRDDVAEEGAMTIALTLQKYLDAKNVRYDLMRHEPTSSSMETAEVCHVSGDCIAKGVLLRDETGYALAILPASHHIRFSALKSQLGEDVELASEYEAAELFQDCTRGALPAVGECYGLDMIVDDSIEKQPEVYFEAGDHGTLIHMSHGQFAALTAAARHGSFSVHD